MGVEHTPLRLISNTLINYTNNNATFLNLSLSALENNFMKSASIICIITFFAFFSSCKKDNSNISTSLIGTWELRQVSGMMTTNYSSGNGNILKFTETGYEMYWEGQLTKSGQYAAVHDASVSENTCLVFDAGEFTNRIIYDNDTNAAKEFFKISNNKFTLVSGCFAVDAGAFREYERIEEESN